MQLEPSEPRETEDRLRSRIEAYHEAALAYAAVKLTLPETMGSKDWTADRLASALGLSAPHLERMLNGLVTLGLAKAATDEAGKANYRLTNAGQALTSSPLREKLLVVIEQYWQPWTHLASSVASGRPAFDVIFGENVHDWRQSNAEQGEAFNTYLARVTFADAEPILERLDLSGVETVAQLGGGHGGLLAAMLARHASLKGVLVDRPQALEGARAFLESAGVLGRVSLVAGGIFETASLPADMVLLNGVLQHYDDAQAHKILETCRAALKPGARLVVIERLMPDRPFDDPAAVMLDLHMMTITGGKARTRAELEALFDTAQLTIAASIQPEDGAAIVEAIAP